MRVRGHDDAESEELCAGFQAAPFNSQRRATGPPGPAVLRGVALCGSHSMYLSIKWKEIGWKLRGLSPGRVKDHCLGAQRI